MSSDEFPFFCAVDFQLSVPTAPWAEAEFYVQEITGVVKAMTSDTREVQAGTIKLLLVHVSQAANDGIDLLDVCDAHSDFLVALYHALIDEDGETRPELDIEPAWHDLIVLLEFDMPVEFRAAGGAVRAFATAIAAFGSMDLIAATTESDAHCFSGLGLTAEEWRQLGFRRIAGSPFAFCETCRVNPYRTPQAE